MVPGGSAGMPTRPPLFLASCAALSASDWAVSASVVPRPAGGVPQPAAAGGDPVAAPAALLGRGGCGVAALGRGGLGLRAVRAALLLEDLAERRMYVVGHLGGDAEREQGDDQGAGQG